MSFFLLIAVLSGQVYTGPDSALAATVMEVVLRDATEYRRGDRPNRVWLMPEARGEIFQMGKFGSQGEGRIDEVARKEDAIERSGNRIRIRENGIIIESVGVKRVDQGVFVEVEYMVQWLLPGTSMSSPVHCPRKIVIHLTRSDGLWKVESVASLREC